MNSQSGLPLGFEFVDIEIINDKKDDEVKKEKWDCDHCSLFFLSRDKLELHKNTHIRKEEIVKCKYCDKILTGEESKECYSNRKCETCEYRCSQCPQRFLRQSSLLNHEKNHLTTKKRRRSGIANNKKQVDGVGEQIIDVPKKRGSRQINSGPLKETDLDDPKLSNSPRKRRKMETEVPVPEIPVVDTKNSVVVDIGRRISRRNLPVKDSSPIKNKLTETVNSIPLSSPTNGSTKENTVNYKPFSCHICGETFASDNTLLSHIKTHGKTAEKAFKCKFCGDKFEDIYKMQYHLAICRYAEDELESTLNKSCASKPLGEPIINNSLCLSNGDSPMKKRGRHFKETDCTPDTVKESNASTSLRTRNRLVKRKSVAFSECTTIDTNTSLRKRGRGLRKSVQETVDMSEEDDPIPMIVDNDEVETEALICVNGTHLEESASDEDGRRKVHLCPHPSCGLKFTREKAMLCHFRNHEDSDGSIKCFKCGIPFDDQHDLSTHIKECKGIKEENDVDYSDPLDQNESCTRKKRTRGDFMCKICGKTYMTKDKLKQHMEFHPSSNFTCRICKHVFDKKVLLEKHYVAVHPTKTPHHCDTCGEDFMSETFLTRHMVELHKTINNIASPIGNSTGINRQLSMYSDSANEAADVQYRLKMLKGFNYGTVSKIMAKNVRNNKFTCAVCCLTFGSKTDLCDHLQSNHILERNSEYFCLLCETEKPTIEMMFAHLQLHSLHLLSVNKFAGIRGSCMKPRKDRETCTNVFPNFAVVKPEIDSEEDVIEEEHTLGRTSEDILVVKPKRSQTNNSIQRKNRLGKESESCTWMRNNNDLRYNKSMSKTDEDKLPIQKKSVTNELVAIKRKRSKAFLRYRGPRQRRKSRKDAKLKGGGLNTVNANQLYEVSGDDEIKEEGSSSINIDQFDEGSMNGSDDNIPQIKENVELLLKKLSDDTMEENNKVDCEEDVSYNPCADNKNSKPLTVLISNVPENDGASNCDDNYNEGSSKVPEVDSKKTKKNSKKIVKITKMTPQKQVSLKDRKEKQEAKSYSNPTGESDIPAQVTTDNTPPVVEKEEPICCTMCSMPFYNQDELFDHVGTHI